MLEFWNYDETVIEQMASVNIVPRRGDKCWLKDEQQYRVAEVIFISRGVLGPDAAPQIRVYVELIDDETKPADNAIKPYDGHHLDFDENSNWYLIPVDQYDHFLAWAEKYRLDFKPDLEDLLPGMIPVDDLTNVVITDYTIIKSEETET